MRTIHSGASGSERLRCSEEASARPAEERKSLSKRLELEMMTNWSTYSIGYSG